MSGGVSTSPVDSRDPVSNSTGYILNMFSFQFFDQIRRELVANSVHTVESTRLNSIVESRPRRQCVLDIGAHTVTVTAMKT